MKEKYRTGQNSVHPVKIVINALVRNKIIKRLLEGTKEYFLYEGLAMLDFTIRWIRDNISVLIENYMYITTCINFYRKFFLSLYQSRFLLISSFTDGKMETIH